MTPISFITPIKNRTNIIVEHKGNKIQLKLFENTLQSLLDIITPEDCWEYVIVDFKSDDVNMSTFIKSLQKPDNLTFKIHTMDQPFFDRGGGINVGIELASHPVIFVLDADMMIKSRQMFDDIEDIVVKQNKVLFPICWSYRNPEHTHGWKRETGRGNVVQEKNTVVKYMNNKCWGREDDYNYDYYCKLGIACRSYYDDNFSHQWHPEEIKHKYYKKK
jgi:glycosyltransferase involved in cell wall biosynthesis